MKWNFKEQFRNGIEKITHENESLREELELLKLVNKANSNVNPLFGQSDPTGTGSSLNKIPLLYQTQRSS